MHQTVGRSQQPLVIFPGLVKFDIGKGLGRSDDIFIISVIFIDIGAHPAGSGDNFWSWYTGWYGTLRTIFC